MPAGELFDVQVPLLTSGAGPVRAAGDTLDEYGGAARHGASGAAAGVVSGPLVAALHGFAGFMAEGGRHSDEVLGASAATMRANAAAYQASDGTAAALLRAAYRPVRVRGLPGAAG